MCLSRERTCSNRVEVKNVAGAKNVEKAVEYEFRRHVALLEAGKCPDAETRRFCADTNSTITLRKKDQEPDYRFFQDPDLPRITVTNDRISRLHGRLGEVPFEVKRRFTNQFGMDVADVKNIFRNPWSVELFTRLIWSLQIDPKTVYNWVYLHIYGNCEKKDLDFEDAIMVKFGFKKLVELLTMLETGKVTAANGKLICMSIIDGDDRMPTEIAEDFGMTTSVNIEAEVQSAVQKVINEQPEIVQKIKGGKPKAIMSLMGMVMKEVNRKGDPVVIKTLLETAIMGSTNYSSTPDEPNDRH